MLGHLGALAYGLAVAARSAWSGVVVVLVVGRDRYHRPMPARSSLSRKAKLRFFAIYSTFAAVMSVAHGYALWGDLNGGNATATVVHVYSQTAYTIRYVTEDDIQCETPHKWDPRTEPIRASDTFEVRYSKILPCDNVRRADAGFSWFGGFLIGPVLMTAGLAAIVLVKRQPKTLSCHSACPINATPKSVAVTVSRKPGRNERQRQLRSGD